MNEWLAQRRELVDSLSQALRAGFVAVAAFDAPAYLDRVEQQEELCRRIAVLDQRLPPLWEASGPDDPGREAAAAELKTMNAELQRLADIQAALIAHGSRSIRSFQRVWALGASGYRPPQE
ncbi:MAG TPA: hypothetical protein VNE83_05280 [Terriglobales bacterium]|nr:hypothetical protein [Terriglobales bacterium]